jgi:hypothetical protein
MTKNAVVVLLALVVAALFLSGCHAQQLQYSPNEIANKDDAVKWVERLLREQPAPNAPSEVEVTKEYFRSYTDKIVRSGAYGGITSHQVTTTVYFDNVKELTLYQKKRLFTVVLLDNANVIAFRYFHYDVDKAKKFMDAVSALKK